MALCLTFRLLRTACTRPCCRALREDRTLIAAADYIASALGQRYVEGVPLNMERAWAESRPKTPLICLLSAGERAGRGQAWSPFTGLRWCKLPCSLPCASAWSHAGCLPLLTSSVLLCATPCSCC